MLLFTKGQAVTENPENIDSDASYRNEDALILIVDDDVAVNLRLLEMILTKEKYNVVKAGNGKLAINIATEQQPDLILLDVMMPEMDGYEVCRILKSSAPPGKSP